MLFATNIAVDQDVIAAATTIALILYSYGSDVQQHRMLSRSRVATLLWSTDFRRRPSTKLSRIYEVDPVVI